MSTNWITLSQTAGTGNQVVTVSAVTNEVMSERQLRIKITTGGKTEYVFVTQEAAPVVVTRLEFTSVLFPSISYTGGTLTASDGTYNITAYYSDGTVVSQVPATVTGNSFSSSAVNFSFSNVSAGTMNLTASFSGKSASTVYTVMQEPMAISDYQIVYSADTQITSFSQSALGGVSSHTFSNGLGIITFNNKVENISTLYFDTGNVTGTTGILEKICLPSCVTNIANSSFACGSLEEIWFYGTKEEFNNIDKRMRVCAPYPAYEGWDALGTFDTVYCTDGNIHIDRIVYETINDDEALKPDCESSIDAGNTYKDSFSPTAENFTLGKSYYQDEHYYQQFQIVVYDKYFEGVGTHYVYNNAKKNAFNSKSGVTKVFLTDTVKTIGQGAFSGCTNLTSINLDNVEFIDKEGFTKCGFTSLIIPSGISFGPIVDINNNVKGHFNQCPNLNSVEINSKHTGGYGYSIALSSVTLSNNTDYIDEYAFDNCSGITSIIIPDNVKEIGRFAFYKTNISAITIGDYVEKVGYDAFHNTPWYNNHSGETYVTLGKILYTTNNLPAYSSISISTPTYYCVADRAFYNSRIGSVDINVPYIGELSFAGQYARNLSAVTFGNDVIKIGDYAFQNRSKITSITIPNNVTSIGIGAFKSCSGITSVSFENGLISIEDEAFYECKSIISLTIPNSATSIGNSAFQYCTSLSSITIPNTVTSMGGNGTFWGCNSLVSVVLPPVIENVDFTYTFYECNNLVSVTVPYGVTGLGGQVFYGCSNLSYVSLPETINKIANGNFSGCNNLQSITFTGTKAQWNNITKTSGWKNNSAISVIHCTDGDISV